MTKVLNMGLRVVAVVAGMVGTAAGQTRVHQPALPDVELMEALVPASYQGRDHDEVDRLSWGTGVSGATRPGEDGAIGGAHAALRIGRRYALGTFVAARSEVRGVAAGDTGEGESRAEVAGRHRALARVAVGNPRDRKFGVDLGAELRATHAGERHVALGPAHILPGAYHDVYAEGEVAPRRGGKANDPDAVALSLPFTYGVGKTVYAEGGAVRGVDRRVAGASFDVRFYDPHVLDTTLTFVGGRIDRRSYTVGPAATARAGTARPAATAPAAEAEVASFDVTSVQASMYVDDEDLLILGDFGYGGARMITRAASGLSRKESIFTIRYAVAVQGRKATVGFAASRQGDVTGDGNIMVADNRLSLYGRLRAGSIAGKIAGEASWLREVGAPRDRDRGRLGRYGLHAETWYELPRGFEVGVYEVATLDTVDIAASGVVPSDPWERRRGWSVEMGGFVRIRGD